MRVSTGDFGFPADREGVIVPGRDVDVAFVDVTLVDTEEGLEESVDPESAEDVPVEVKTSEVSGVELAGVLTRVLPLEDL